MKSFDDVLTLVPGMTHDLGGGFVVRRLLPFRKKRMVGPFAFFDHMGPAEFRPDRQTDIRPHPHIGLSTVTYLFEGRMVHRDSLGNVQTILPGEVNWMAAGKGITHSERAHADDYGKPVRMQGLQFWVALPDGREDGEPTFDHYAADTFPVFEGAGFRATVIAGKAFGLTSSVKVTSPTLFVEVKTNPAAGGSVADAAARAIDVAFTAPEPGFEVALYVVAGRVSYESHPVEAGQLVVLKDASALRFAAAPGSHFIVIGGEPFKTPRFMYWNFVSSSRDRLEAAKLAWKEERFPLIPGDSDERIPLGD